MVENLKTQERAVGLEHLTLATDLESLEYLGYPADQDHPEEVGQLEHKAHEGDQEDQELKAREADQELKVHVGDQEVAVAPEDLEVSGVR